MDLPATALRRRSILKRPSESATNSLLSSMNATTTLLEDLIVNGNNQALGSDSDQRRDGDGDQDQFEDYEKKIHRQILKKRVSFGHNCIKEFESLTVTDTEAEAETDIVGGTDNHTQMHYCVDQANMELSFSNFNATYLVQNPEYQTFPEKDVTFCLHRFGTFDDYVLETGRLDVQTAENNMTDIFSRDMNISHSELSIGFNNATFLKPFNQLQDKTVAIPIEMDESSNNFSYTTSMDSVAAENKSYLQTGYKTVYGGDMLLTQKTEVYQNIPVTRKPFFESNINERPRAHYGNNINKQKLYGRFATLKTPNRARDATFLLESDHPAKKPIAVSDISKMAVLEMDKENINKELKISSWEKEISNKSDYSNLEDQEEPSFRDSFLDTGTADVTFSLKSLNIKNTPVTNLSWQQVVSNKSNCSKLEDQEIPSFYHSKIDHSFHNSYNEVDVLPSWNISHDVKLFIKLYHQIRGLEKVALYQNVMNELIQMPEDIYTKFKELYHHCFHPDYLRAIDINKSAINKLKQKIRKKNPL